VASRLTSFIKTLGYAARPHTPGASYDLMVPPIMVDAGLGEQGRHSIVITPELGCNFRPAVVTTNLPLVPDKPIDFGVQDFCKTCKICAENCPSGAITMDEREEVRGYLRYPVSAEKCHNFWSSCLGNMGCRICIAVCPYSRKSNWLHRTALKLTTNDLTGLSHEVLVGLQKRLYPGPDPEEYFMPSLGGKNATYRDPPWWLRTEDFVDIEPIAEDGESEASEV
jgi:reductive dehalogenase